MDKLSTFIDSFGGSALAARLGVSKSTVSSWRHGRFRIPAERCRQLESLSDGLVTVHDLRPDVFGPPAVVRRASDQQEPAA